MCVRVAGKETGWERDADLFGVSVPARTASKVSSCFLKPGMDADAMFSDMTSCQRALAFSADAAWYRLTFTGLAKHRMCHRVKTATFRRKVPESTRFPSTDGKNYRHEGHPWPASRDCGRIVL